MIGWIVVLMLFVYYVNYFNNYIVIYGSLGGIIILFIWLYLLGMIIVIGGEINVIFYDC